MIGFAAESGDPVERGRQKLLRKGADLIVANDITAAGSGFDSELNAASLISHDGVETFPLGPKTALAALILDRAEARLAPLTTPHVDPRALSEHLRFFQELGVTGISRDPAWRRRAGVPLKASLDVLTA